MSAEGTVLLVATNGVGLGHVTRAAAVARRLQEQRVPVVLCSLSPLVAPFVEMGLLVEHVPSYAVTGLPRWRWQRMLADQISHLVDVYDVDLVAFDGVAPYNGVRWAAAGDGAPPFVWIRRDRRRDDRVRRAAPTTGFVAVIEPREHLPGQRVLTGAAGQVGPDRTPVHPVDPVLLHDHADLLPAAEARAVLGLEPGRPHGLVSLGTGADGPLAAAEAQVVAALRSRGILPVVARSPLVGEPAVPPPPPGAAADLRHAGGDEVRVVRRYPLAPTLRAFDVAVVAAGYNSAAEVIACRVPAVLVSNPGTSSDDQAARVRALDHAGLVAGWVPEDADRPVADALEACLGDAGAALRARLEATPPPQGARQAAALLAGMRRGGTP